MQNKYFLVLSCSLGGLVLTKILGEFYILISLRYNKLFTGEFIPLLYHPVAVECGWGLA